MQSIMESIVAVSLAAALFYAAKKSLTYNFPAQLLNSLINTAVAPECCKLFRYDVILVSCKTIFVMLHLT